MYAFNNCKRLVFIKWSLSLAYIGRCAFYKCNLSSIFLPPSCREIRREAFARNKNLSILHVPQDTMLGPCIFYKTAVAKASPFNAIETVNHWLKNMNHEEEFALHRACSSFQPLKEVLYPIILQKGLKAFKEKNSAGITPSKYLQENPYTELIEKEIIHDYLMKMMGEVG